MKIKFSTVSSIIFHVLILFIIFYNNQINKVITPSRSDGISINLISDDQITQVNKTLPQQTLKVPENSTPNDINLKNPSHIENESRQLTKLENKPLLKLNHIKEPKATLSEPHKLLNKPIYNKKVQKASAIEDLLKQIPNIDKESTGTSNFKAKDGNKNGTSDSKSNQINNYASQVIKKIIPYIIIPDDVDNKINAIIEVTLLPNLSVYTIKLKKSSGNKTYDDNVQQAILNASSFPPLPQNAKFSDYRVLTLIFRPE